jgi:CHAD domain-containing protein
MDTKYEHVSISIDMTAIMSLHQETSTEQQNSFTTGQSWGALRKAWKGYRIAKVQDDNTKMTEYATKIRKIQEELGVSRASFPHLGIS